jgi:PiT family inorganic phosphate transporter
MSVFLVIIIILLALIYDFLNGANDRANAIATVTATKALSPIRALILASVLNLAGAFFSTRVAQTIGKGIIPSEEVTLFILLAGVLGANFWLFACTRTGVPISVTHSLVGGIMGAGLAAEGPAIINWSILTNKVFLAIVLGPIAGLVAGSFIFSLIAWLLFLFFKKIPVQKGALIFKKLQIASASFMAWTHGLNDTQNAMGLITATLLAGGLIETFAVPLWVKIGSGIMMGLGTFFMGWRVMKTLGWRLTKLEPQHGFAAETGAGIVVGLHSAVGMPVSTTHVIGSAVLGGTLLQNWRRVRQLVAWRMITAWIITIPAAGITAALTYFILTIFSKFLFML